MTHETIADAIEGAQSAGTVAPWPFTLARDLKPNLSNSDIVRDLIPRDSFGEVHADAGGGKTTIILDLSFHIAGGIEYRGRRVERQPVVYVALEGHAGIDNRALAARRNLGLEDVPLALVKISSNFREPEAAQRTAALALKLKELYGGACPVIVIDTYTAALDGGSDCDPKDVGAFIENTKRHMLAVGCTVLLSHHFGKDASRGGRGWSGLRAALDFELEIERDGDLRVMRVTKSRDGSDSQPGMCFRFRPVELGVNNYGEPVTVVVADHLDDEDVAKPGKRLSPTARAALDKLWQMIKDPASSFPMQDMPGLRCVLFSEWEKACIAPDAISKCKRERDRQRQFNTAKDELDEAKAIICDGERVCPAPPNERGEARKSHVSAATIEMPQCDSRESPRKAQDFARDTSNSNDLPRSAKTRETTAGAASGGAKNAKPPYKGFADSRTFAPDAPNGPRERVGICPSCRFDVFHDNAVTTASGAVMHPACACEKGREL
jgi:hypothetical protein